MRESTVLRTFALSIVPARPVAEAVELPVVTQLMLSYRFMRILWSHDAARSLAPLRRMPNSSPGTS